MKSNKHIINFTDIWGGGGGAPDAGNRNRSRTSSVGKVDDSESVSGLNLATNLLKKKSACAVGQAL